MFDKLHPVIQTFTVNLKGLRCDGRFRGQTRSDTDLLLACSAAQCGLKRRKQTDFLQTDILFGLRGSITRFRGQFT